MFKSAIVIAGILAVAACASTGMSTADRLALYRAHAGTPVMSFRLDTVNRFHRWTPLGDEALAVWTSTNQGHLLEFRSRCTGLGMAASISISNSAGRVSARFDSVRTRSAAGTLTQQVPCRIDTIRPLDGRSLRDAKRELRGASLVENTTEPPQE